VFAVPFLYRRTGILSLAGICIALLVVPLAFGGSTPATQGGIDLLLASSVAVGLFARAGSREKLQFQFWPTLWVAILATLGAVAILNPSHVYLMDTDELRPLPSFISWLPSSYDRASSLGSVIHLSVLAATFLLLVDLCRDSAIRWRLLQAIAISGTIVAIIGIVQKLSGTPSMLWLDKVYHEHEKTFFAAFRYHGHAAAFLNLCWPATAALAIRSFSKKKRRNHVERALWVNSLLFTLAALLFNTSKFGHVLLLPGMVMAIVLFRHRIVAVIPNSSTLRRMTIAGALCAAVLASLVIPVASRSFGNWAWELDNGGSLAGRLQCYRICLDAIAAGGPFGFGPGTFQYVFPYFATPYGNQTGGLWNHAHQEYLQAMIEWGWLGAAPWFALFGLALWRYLSRKRSASNNRPGLHGTSKTAAFIAIVLLCAHAMIDFPLRIAAIQLYATVYLAILCTATPRASKNQPGS